MPVLPKCGKLFLPLHENKLLFALIICANIAQILLPLSPTHQIHVAQLSPLSHPSSPKLQFISLFCQTYGHTNSHRNRDLERTARVI